MSNRLLLQRFDAWRACETPLVLCTVIETAGSTYSKTGRHLLIAPNGQYAGLVSGGCLEGDLLLQAEQVRASGTPRVVSYDLREPDDALWGMGSGCNGLLRLLLQPLDAAHDWQPFSRLAELMAAPASTEVTLVLSGTHADYAPGDLLSGTNHALQPSTPLPCLHTHQLDGGSAEAVHWEIRPWPRLLLLGAGPDAAPLAQLANALGWECHAADHRPEALERARQWPVADVVDTTPENLADDTALAAFDAVVLMTHHLLSDVAYLQTLARYQHRYVGVLGPRDRHARLLLEAGLTDSAFARQLRGPVGLDIGADSPAGIALAVVAEIHAVLAERSARSMSLPAAIQPATTMKHSA